MKPVYAIFSGLGFALAVFLIWAFQPKPSELPPVNPIILPVEVPPPVAPPVITENNNEDEKPMPAFVSKGLDWLVKAQFENGGWGAGMHARQDIKDPRSVQIDPATTAFAAMALLRAGNTLDEGLYHKNFEKALMYMVELVESSPKEGVQITTITGTQPQAKLGQNIDVSMAAQLFTRVLPLLDNRPALSNRVRVALQTCLDKLARAQSNDGSWNDRGGWAAVLQSAMANSAFEAAEQAGLEFDEEVLDKSRKYQKSNIDTNTGAVRTESAAGISLYSITSNQRATAKEARKVEDLVTQAKKDGRISQSTAPSAEVLQELGVSRDDARELADAYKQNVMTRDMLKDDEVLKGFGNNGGEEFLSHMMTSESLVVTGGDDWTMWYARLSNLLSSIQNNDGSWSGHHCITSPVFCTTAVIMAMLAERDKAYLVNQVK